MNITKSNYFYLKQPIIKLLSNCDYIAVDLEFTGTKASCDLINTKFDTVNYRYFKLLNAVKPYIPLQLGLCGINIKEDKYYPFNFYIFPDNDDIVSIDLSTVKFLASNSFDFNKAIFDGIPYKQKDKISKIDYNDDEKTITPEMRIFLIRNLKIIKNYIDLNANDTTNDQSPLKIDVAKFKNSHIKYLLRNIKKYINKEIILEIDILDNSILLVKLSSIEKLKQKFNSLKIKKNKSFLRKWLFYQNLYIFDNKDLSNIWKKVIIEQLINQIVEEQPSLKYSTIDNIINEIGIEGFNEQKLNYFINLIYKNEDSIELSKIREDLKLHDKSIKKETINDLLIELVNKPLIFHNGIYDIMHIFDKLIGQLPLEFNLFRTEVLSKFPTIYDTKYIAENSLIINNILGKNTSLENIKKILESKSLINYNNDLNNLLRKIMNEDSNNNDGIARDILIDYEFNDLISNHNAGYDSYLTAKAFKYFLDSSPNLINNLDACFLNRLLISGNDNIFDLSIQAEPISELKDLLIIRNMKIANIEEIKVFICNNLGLLNPNFIKLYDSNNIIIQLRSQSEIQSVNNLIEQSENRVIIFYYNNIKIEISQYADYLIEVVKY